MIKKYLLYIILLLLSASFVFSAPVFVRNIPQDLDTVYGNNDPAITLLTLWDKSSYSIWADFSSVESSPVNLTGFVSNEGGGIYKIAYNITLSMPDGNYSVIINAIDPLDNSSNTSTFNVTLDNTPPSIFNENSTPEVVFNVTDITINATVTDPNSITDINISGTWTDGSYRNFSVLDLLDPRYMIDSSFVGDDETIYWRYYAKDNANNLGLGSLQTIDVIKRTIATVVPNSPNGCNDWYIVEPQFILAPDAGRTAFYRFDSLANNIYTTPFNYSGVPGGSEILNYWSNDTFNNQEPLQPLSFKVDITSPLTTALDPANTSTVSSLRPEISAYIDEVYFDNSGTDSSSIIMKLDDAVVSHTFSIADTLDGIVEYTPLIDLAPGRHNISVFVKDNACLNSTREWHFFINDTIPIISISSPYDGFESSERRIGFNISVTPESRLQYSIDNGNHRTICSKCSETRKSISFKEGSHNISIKAVNRDNGAVSTENLSVFVDFKKPRVRKTIPRRNKFGFGFFNLTYTEDFLDRIDFFIKGALENNFTLVPTNCSSSGKKQVCGHYYDLSSYNNQDVTYYFQVFDRFRDVSSRPTSIKVDLTAPSFINTSPSPGSVFNTTSIHLGANLDERVKFLKYSDNGKRPRSLCSRCSGTSKRKRFSEGFHNITFYAIDYAGNTAEDSTSFEVS